MVARFKGGAERAGEVIPDCLFVGAFECFLEAVPGGGAGEEGWADVAAETVVASVEEPGGTWPLRWSLTSPRCHYLHTLSIAAAISQRKYRKN